MNGFTKLFSSIVTSSIWNEDDKTRIVWITMLAIADKAGRVWASKGGLAHSARVTRDELEKAVTVLLSPDPDSRTPDFEGRRIEAIDGGWKILNYRKYREHRDDDCRREYMRDYMAKKRRDGGIPSNPDEQNVNIVNSVSTLLAGVSRSLPPLAQAEAEAEAENIIAPTQSAKPYWSEPKGWENVDSLRSEFSEAFPACNFDMQLQKATLWLKANPTKAKKSNWRKFLTNWFVRCQDRGGDGKGAGNPVSAPKPACFDRGSIPESAFNQFVEEQWPGNPDKWTLQSAPESVIKEYLATP